MLTSRLQLQEVENVLFITVLTTIVISETTGRIEPKLGINIHWMVNVFLLLTRIIQKKQEAVKCQNDGVFCVSMWSRLFFNQSWSIFFFMFSLFRMLIECAWILAFPRYKGSTPKILNFYFKSDH